MTTQQEEFIESCFNRLEMIQEGIKRVEETQEKNQERIFGVDIMTEKNKHETANLLKEVKELKNVEV